ncbi:MAG: hypothetical protein HY700_21990 [Gemmatimonadetes bacterium]|nr:hypothetical protein [Gemmatimonadota bacterium]
MNPTTQPRARPDSGAFRRSIRVALSALLVLILAVLPCGILAVARELP